MVPELGLSRPPKRFNNVDFPDPEGPVIPKKAPFGMDRDTSVKASTWTFPRE
jgi:hypothetical protein